MDTTQENEQGSYQLVVVVPLQPLGRERVVQALGVVSKQALLEPLEKEGPREEHQVWYLKFNIVKKK